MPVSKQLFEHLRSLKQQSDEFEAKFETKAKAKMQNRPVLEQATLAQIQSGKYQVNSVNPDIFNDTYVIPWVDLYCGAGGMEFGSVRKQGNFTLVCVLAIDNDEKMCATHRLSHPEVPVVQQTLTTWPPF